MSGEWSIPEHLTWQYYGECDDFDPHQGVSENTRRREIDETPDAELRQAEYDRLIREEAELAELDYRSLPTEGRLIVEPDAEFQFLLSNEHDELNPEVNRHHRDFESISALCLLWRNGHFSAEDTIRKIQNIVG